MNGIGSAAHAVPSPLARIYRGGQIRTRVSGRSVLRIRLQRWCIKFDDARQQVIRELRGAAVLRVFMALPVSLS